MPKYQKGQTVNVLNMTMSGTVFIEGRAEIIKPIKGMDNQYVVQFVGDRDGLGGPVERFIDPKAQSKNIAAYVAELNDPR